MTITGTISNVSYAKITTLTKAEFWTINPFDLSGNLFSEITIEADTSLGDVTFVVPYLEPYDPMFDPYYGTNGGTNITIKIIKISPDPQLVIIQSIGSTIFSGANSEPQLFTLDNLGDSLSISPIGTQPIYEVNYNWKLQ
jgi:hypothetical protein